MSDGQHFRRGSFHELVMGARSPQAEAHSPHHQLQEPTPPPGLTQTPTAPTTPFEVMAPPPRKKKAQAASKPDPPGGGFSQFAHINPWTYGSVVLVFPAIVLMILLLALDTGSGPGEAIPHKSLRCWTGKAVELNGVMQSNTFRLETCSVPRTQREIPSSCFLEVWDQRCTSGNQTFSGGCHHPSLQSSLAPGTSCQPSTRYPSCGTGVWLHCCEEDYCNWDGHGAPETFAEGKLGVRVFELDSVHPHLMRQVIVSMTGELNPASGYGDCLTLIWAVAPEFHEDLSSERSWCYAGTNLSFQQGADGERDTEAPPPPFPAGAVLGRWSTKDGAGAPICEDVLDNVRFLNLHGCFDFRTELEESLVDASVTVLLDGNRSSSKLETRAFVFGNSEFAGPVSGDRDVLPIGVIPASREKENKTETSDGSGSSSAAAAAAGQESSGSSVFPPSSIKKALPGLSGSLAVGLWMILG